MWNCLEKSFLIFLIFTESMLRFRNTFYRRYIVFLRRAFCSFRRIVRYRSIWLSIIFLPKLLLFVLSFSILFAFFVFDIFLDFLNQFFLFLLEFLVA